MAHAPPSVLAAASLVSDPSRAGIEPPRVIIAAANASFAALAGRSAAALSGRSPVEVLAWPGLTPECFDAAAATAPEHGPWRAAVDSGDGVRRVVTLAADPFLPGRWILTVDDAPAGAPPRSDAPTELADRLDKLARHLPGVIYQYRQDAGGHCAFPYASDGMRMIYGFAPADLVDDASPVFDLIHPDDLQHVADSIQHSAATLQPWFDQYRVRHPQRGEIWVEGHATPERLPDGGVLWHGYLSEITERQRIAAALRQSEERLALILGGTSDAPWDWDLTTGRLYYAPRWWEMLGLDIADVDDPGSPMLWRDRLHPDDRDRVAAQEQAILGDPAAPRFTLEFRLRHADGHYVPILCRGVVLRDADGVPRRIVGANMDQTARRALENALAENERLYRSFVEAVPDALFLVEVGAGPDGKAIFRTVRTNPAFQRVQALSRPDRLARVERWLAESVAAAAPVSYEETLEGPDGRQVWGTTLAPVADADGRIALVVGIAHDLTESRAAEAALRSSEERLRALFDLFPDAVVLIDPATGRAAQFNQAAYGQLGYDSETFAGLSITDYEALETPGETAARLLRVAETGSDIFESRHRRADGSVIDVHVSVKGLTLEGRPYQLAVMRDITELRRTAEAERAARERLDTYIHLAPLGIYVIEPEGRFAEVNRAACAQSGFSTKELTAMTVSTYAFPEDREVALRHFTQAREGTASGEMRLRRKGGGWFWATVVAGVLPDGHVIAFIEDIGTRKRMEMDLQRSNAELEQFAYVASHDLRQPLRMVNSYTQLLERALADHLTDKTREFMGFVRDGAQRMDQMLVGLLEYSRIGRIGEPMVPVEARALVDEALRYLEPVIRETGAVVRIEGLWPTITASRDEGVRLFQNLIGNAIKYGPRDGRTHVMMTVSPVPGGWEFSVSDNGIGIDPEHFDRLFKVFQRLHPRSAYEGTGIGLAVCRRIVERHGGRIRVESRGPGLGAAFIFFLPEKPPEPSVARQVAG